MEKRSVMSPELIGILSVGVALAGLIVSAWGRIETSIDRLDHRIDRIEASIETVETRLNHVGRDVAVLLERIAPLSPVAAKQLK